MNMIKMRIWFVLFTISLGLMPHLRGEEEIRLALAGSSACQSYGNSHPEYIYGWGEVIGKYFKPEVKILNFAISGYSTKSFLERGKWENLLQSKPHFILMSLGANDSKKKEGFFTNPDKEYQENLRRFAADAEKIGAKIIFVTLNTRLKFNKEGKCVAPDRLAYSNAMRKVASDLGKPCLELEKHQMAELNKIGPEAGKLLYRINPRNGKLDISHTNLKGAEMVANIIILELKKCNSELKNHLLPEKQ